MNGDLSRLNARVTIIIIVTRRIHVYISGQLGGRTVAIHRFEPPTDLCTDRVNNAVHVFYNIYIS